MRECEEAEAAAPTDPEGILPPLHHGDSVEGMVWRASAPTSRVGCQPWWGESHPAPQAMRGVPWRGLPTQLGRVTPGAPGREGCALATHAWVGIEPTTFE